MDIEEVAAQAPRRRSSRCSIDPATGSAGFQGRKLAFALGLERRARSSSASTLFERALQGLRREGLLLLEINPLIVTKRRRAHARSTPR